MSRLPWHRWFAVGAAVGLIAFASYRLFIGVATNIDTINGTASTVRSPQPSAAIPLAAGLLYLAGLIWRRRSLVTVGGAAAVAYGVLFIFSAGPYYGPIAVVLLILGLMTSRSWDTTAG